MLIRSVFALSIFDMKSGCLAVDVCWLVVSIHLPFAGLLAATSEMRAQQWKDCFSKERNSWQCDKFKLIREEAISKKGWTFKWSVVTGQSTSHILEWDGVGPWNSLLKRWTFLHWLRWQPNKMCELILVVLSALARCVFEQEI